MEEKRKFKRLCFPLKVRCMAESALAKDIGAGGIGIFIDQGIGSGIKINNCVTLEIPLPDGFGNIFTEAKAVWVNMVGGSNIAGLEFIKMNALDRSRIVSFVSCEKNKESFGINCKGRQIALFRQAEFSDKESVISLISQNANYIEQGLKIIDKNINLSEAGIIDILGITAGGEIAIIDISMHSDDATLLLALRQFDWVLRHSEVLKKLYNIKAYPNHNPKIVIIAPGFSDYLKRIISDLASIKIELLEYRCIESEDAKGILLNNTNEKKLDGLTEVSEPQDGALHWFFRQ